MLLPCSGVFSKFYCGKIRLNPYAKYSLVDCLLTKLWQIDYIHINLPINSTIMKNKNKNMFSSVLHSQITQDNISIEYLNVLYFLIVFFLTSVLFIQNCLIIRFPFYTPFTPFPAIYTFTIFI